MHISLFHFLNPPLAAASCLPVVVPRSDPDGWLLLAALVVLAAGRWSGR